MCLRPFHSFITRSVTTNKIPAGAVNDIRVYETASARYRLFAEGTHVPSLRDMRTRTLPLLLEFQGHLVIGLGKPVLTLVQKTKYYGTNQNRAGYNMMTARHVFISIL